MSTRVSQLGIFQSGFRDDNDVPVTLGSVEFYTADQTYTTPKNAYSTKDKAASFTSVTLDANGAYPTGLYFDGATVYDLRLKNASGTTIRNYTNVKIPETTYNTRTVTGTTITASIDDDLILCDTTSNPITVNMVEVSNVVKPITVKNIGDADNDVTVDGSGAELIDGQLTATLADGASQQYATDGFGWYGAGVATGITFTSTSLIAGFGITLTEASGITTISSQSSLIDTQVFTASGTWTKPTGCNAIEVFMVGGGGGGGGVTAAVQSAGGGGGGGAYAYSYIDTSIPASAPVVVGAGGAGNSGATGDAGTASTFDTTTVVADFGRGGVVGDGTTTVGTVDGSGGVGGVVVSCTGDLKIAGSAGGDGTALLNLFTAAGNGGVSQFSSSVPSVKSILWTAVSASGGSAGVGYGVGGIGYCKGNLATVFPGGSGVAGVVIVKSYS